MKTHFGTDTMSVCGRGKRGAENVYRVDCGVCLNHPLFARAKVTADEAREAAFQAQTPRQVSSMWGNGNITCYKCGGDLFRERPRSLFSFHFVCEGCGTSVHPPTETGMCQ